MSGSEIAAVILAHNDPAQVRRLCGAMAGADLFLHCDAKTPEPIYREMVDGLPANVRVLPRRRTSLSSWSLVEAELRGIRSALQYSGAAHIAILSGSCYPLMSSEELCDELRGFRGRSLVEAHPLPFPEWNTPRNPDGGLWRLRRRFVVIRDQIVEIGGVPLRTVRRCVPQELVLHGGSQWKVYARSHAERLLAVLDDRPDLVRFFRHSFVPDETCALTILNSPALVGPVADAILVGSVWYIEWPPDGYHPRWLSSRSFEALATASAPPRPGLAAVDEPLRIRRSLFARKLRSSEPELLDRIDLELRS